MHPFLLVNGYQGSFPNYSLQLDVNVNDTVCFDVDANITDVNDSIYIQLNSSNFNLLNNLNFTDLDLKRYPAIKLLKKIPKKFSLFDTILVSANDYLVELFLNKKILFYEIYYLINYIINLKELQKFKRIKPSSVEDIMRLNKYVHLKLKEKCV